MFFAALPLADQADANIQMPREDTLAGGAFYAFPNISGTGFKSAILQQKLLDECGLAVLSGTSFGAYGEGYLRLSYAADTEVIQEAIERMRQFLEG